MQTVSSCTPGHYCPQSGDRTTLMGNRNRPYKRVGKKMKLEREICEVLLAYADMTPFFTYYVHVVAGCGTRVF